MFGISFKSILGTAVSFALPAVSSFILPPVGGIVGGALGSYLDDEIEGKPVSMEGILLGGAMGGLGGGVGKLAGKAAERFGIEDLGSSLLKKLPGAQSLMARAASQDLKSAVSSLTKDELDAAQRAAWKAAGNKTAFNALSDAEKKKLLDDAAENIAKGNLAKAAADKVATQAAKDAAKNAKPWYKNKFDWNTGRAVGAGLGAGTASELNFGKVPTRPVQSYTPPSVTTG